MNFMIEETQLSYLRAQCGDISHLEGEEWQAAYRNRIEQQYESLLPILPEKMVSSLDIGGGLSGISARLARHYPQLIVAVLDGRCDPPKVVRNWHTHNNACVTQRFLIINGVRDQFYYTPDEESHRCTKNYSLVMSFNSWCFHYAPGRYLPLVMKHTQKGSVVVADIRKSHPEWKAEMCETFGDARLIYDGKKAERIAFLKWNDAT
jgi:hypothetical protein